MESLLNLLNLVRDVVVILGFPLALYQLNRSFRKERKDREEAVYNELDEKYLDFQRLCLQYPFLDIFDIPDSTPSVLTEQQKKEELIIFTFLFSIFERAYLRQRNTHSRTLKEQWSGWQGYIDEYCERENFRTAWKISGQTFDPNFQAFMEKELKKCDHISNQKNEKIGCHTESCGMAYSEKTLNPVQA